MFLIQGMYPAPKVDAVSLFGGYWMGGVVQVPVSSHCEGSCSYCPLQIPLVELNVSSVLGHFLSN